MRHRVAVVVLLSLATACASQVQIVAHELRRPRNDLRMLEGAWLDLEASEVLVEPFSALFGTQEMRELIGTTLTPDGVRGTRGDRPAARFRVTGLVLTGQVATPELAHVVVDLQVGDRLWSQPATWEAGPQPCLVPLVSKDIDPAIGCSLGRALTLAVERLSDRASADRMVEP